MSPKQLHHQMSSPPSPLMGVSNRWDYTLEIICNCFWGLLCVSIVFWSFSFMQVLWSVSSSISSALPFFLLVRFLDSWQFWQLCSKFSSERVSVPQTASVFCISSWSFCLNNWACLTYWCSSCCNEFMKYAYGGLEKPIKTHAFCMALVDFSPPTGLLPPGRCGSARRCSVTVWGEKAVQEPCSWRLVCVFKCGY